MNPPEEEKNDPVWDLLENTRSPEASPFFARNVVREVRKWEDERANSSPLSRCISWFSEAPAARLTAVAGVVVAAIVAVNVLVTPENNEDPGTPILAESSASSPPVESIPVSEPSSDPLIEEFDPVDEMENLDYLGDLMAVTDPAMLDDSTLADLLF